MLANWKEFHHLIRNPSDTKKPLSLSIDGDQIGVAEGFSVVGQHPILIDFSKSLIQKERLLSQKASPIKRRPNWLRLMKGYLFRTSRISTENFHKFRANLPQHPLVLMVGAGTMGSGAKALYDDDTVLQIAFDIYPSVHTQFIADAHRIPLADNSMDGVCVQAVLEHVLDPAQVVSEIHRVLKPGGIIYAETPFMQQVHEGAYDFTRFTELGHRWLFRSFDVVDRGSIGGPGLTLYWAIKYYVWGVTGNRIVGDILSLPFFIIVLSDAFISDNHKIDGANGVYFLGSKSLSRVSCKSIILEYKGAQV